MDTTKRLVQSDQFVLEQVEDEWLLFHPQSQKAIYMDQAASGIWQACDGTRNGEAVAAHIAEDYPDEAEIVRRDVLATLDSLLSEGALEYADA